MGISRRDFFRTAGLAALASTAPIAIRSKVNAAPVQPHYRVKTFGANMSTYCFDKNSRIRKDQIQQVKRWGFKKLRDNAVHINWPLYDLNHARAVTQECLEQGIQYTINAVFVNHGIQNHLTADQWAAVRARYNGNSGYAMIATAAMAIGLNKQPFCNFILDQAQQQRAAYPQGVRMQAFNGPEIEGFLPWNMYDEEFRAFWRSIQVDVPEQGPDPAPLNSWIKSNYENFRNQVKSIWGSPWLDRSTHMYEYIGSWGQRLYVSPAPNEEQQPIITEWGANRNECQNLVNVFRTLPVRMIEHNASAGVLVTDSTGSYNILEMFLHEPLDRRFIDLWQQGRTQLLWNPRQYTALISSMTDNRGHWEAHSGVFMEPNIAKAILETMQSLSGGSGQSAPPRGILNPGRLPFYSSVPHEYKQAA